MVHARYTFVPNFLWGTATAAHAVEGPDAFSQWAAWEQAGQVAGGQQAGEACGWWRGRWRADFERAAAQGHNALRFSLEWSRLQPTPDRWDDDALERYRTWARTARSLGLEPVITLHHFTDPLWLSEAGGWERPQAVEAFRRFVARLVPALRAYVRLWLTFAAPNGYAYRGYVQGHFPPGRQGDERAAWQVLVHMAQAHAAAYETIHRLQPEAQVGVALPYWSLQPARPWLPWDRWAARQHRRLWRDALPAALLHGRLPRAFGRTWPIPSLRGAWDFLGVEYRPPATVRFAPRLRGGWRVVGALPSAPRALGRDFARALAWAQRWGVPIYITADGVDDAQDRQRPAYLAVHVHQIWRALTNNWPIRGYLHWSLVDGFAWERGWQGAFGLWACDPTTQIRRPRGSGQLFAALAQANA